MRDTFGLKYTICKKCGGSGMLDYGDFHVRNEKQCNECVNGRVYEGDARKCKK